MPHLLPLACVLLSVASPGSPPAAADAPLEALEPTEFPNLRPGDAAPLSEGSRQSAPAPLPAGVPLDGAEPLAEPGGGAPASAPASPDDGSPLDRVGPASPGSPPQIVRPLESGPEPAPPPPADPRARSLVRVDLLSGPVWRIQRAETLIVTSVEIGRAQGLSGSVHAGMIVAPDRAFVGAHDFPIGAGVVQRWRLGARSLYASVGLSAGVLVHRALTDQGVIHRVDPDLRLPVRFAWTTENVGFSVALVQGYSVRTRTYSRRGVEVWGRIPYRVGFVVGLHFDAGIGAARPRRPGGRRRGLP